jgi:hypothetical protein
VYTAAMQHVDYYEFLQISPNAEQETIHRVYRFLGARLHPDNPITGDAEKFSLLKNAYEVLSDPAQRAHYDAGRLANSTIESPMSSSVDFMDNMEGELNRRLAVMAVLYFQRRTNPSSPEVSLTELETRMGFPRDYLDFTTWYLKKKGYILMGDNASFALTVDGVDFVETQRANIPVLNKLLTTGAEPVIVAAPDTATQAVTSGKKPVERRTNATDRRKNNNVVPLIERRVSSKDRRANTRGARAN